MNRTIICTRNCNSFSTEIGTSYSYPNNQWLRELDLRKLLTVLFFSFFFLSFRHYLKVIASNSWLHCILRHDIFLFLNIVLSCSLSSFRFNLYKENKDTQEALGVVGTMLGIQVCVVHCWIYSVNSD